MWKSYGVPPRLSDAIFTECSAESLQPNDPTGGLHGGGVFAIYCPFRLVALAKGTRFKGCFGVRLFRHFRAFVVSESTVSFGTQSTCRKQINHKPPQRTLVSLKVELSDFLISKACVDSTALQCETVFIQHSIENNNTNDQCAS